MAIAPIPPISIGSLGPVAPTAPTPPDPTGGSAGVGGTGAASFGDSIAGAIESLSDAHQNVDDLAVQAATGDLTAIHDFTIATSEVQLMTELTVEIRNKAIESFNDIMRMQV
ncbi:flagellar hook-basal body complex protein FliE [Ilumatobacter sp.]|uniref:flagellar hook-basal body complex protein FliE n=1 Tax=Ilumatobacter sp. TaxID=1967498 RepID=UPI003B51D895